MSSRDNSMNMTKKQKHNEGTTSSRAEDPCRMACGTTLFPDHTNTHTHTHTHRQSHTHAHTHIHTYIHTHTETDTTHGMLRLMCLCWSNVLVAVKCLACRRYVHCERLMFVTSHEAPRTSTACLAFSLKVKLFMRISCQHEPGSRNLLWASCAKHDEMVHGMGPDYTRHLAWCKMSCGPLAALKRSTTPLYGSGYVGLPRYVFPGPSIDSASA